MKHLNHEFIITHDCIGRPRGLARVASDLLCKMIGHSIYRVMRSTAIVENQSLPLYASYCLRCYRGGYVSGDYRNA
jgi:hypothetical protein